MRSRKSKRPRVPADDRTLWENLCRGELNSVQFHTVLIIAMAVVGTAFVFRMFLNVGWIQ